MNVNQRAALRQALKGEGFDRTQYTDDIAGTGVYEETWFNGSDVVTISWGERT